MFRAAGPENPCEPLLTLPATPPPSPFEQLADNLNIFSETRAVFPPRELRATLLSPEVQQILERMERERLN